MAAHPGHELEARGKSVFCGACNRSYGNKASLITGHIQTPIHVRNLEMRLAGKKDQPVLTELLKEYDAEHNPDGQSLSTKERMHRVEVLTTLMEAGIPIEKLNNPRFRAMCARGGGEVSLTTPSHMLELTGIPFNLERRKVNGEVDGKPIVLIADGTTRVAEVYTCVGRFWMKGRVVQRVLRLRLLAHSLTGPENAWFLADVVMASGIVWRNVICVAADRAATNKDAFNIITDNEPTFVGVLVGCVPHTFSHVGEKSDLKIMKAFVQALTATLVSTNATTCFKKHFGEAQKRHSNVRWHCEFEQCTQVGLGYPCLQPYMLECEQQGHSTESIKAMRAIVAADGQLLRCELAMNMDAFLPFVNATFVLEGSCALR